MNWKVGDKAIIDYPATSVHGERVTIVSVGEVGRDHEGGDFVGAGVDIPLVTWSSGHCVFRYSQLVPIPDDDNEASWDRIEKLTGWTPKVLERIKEAAP
jgi:hypothetical protein